MKLKIAFFIFVSLFLAPSVQAEIPENIVPIQDVFSARDIEGFSQYLDGKVFVNRIKVKLKGSTVQKKAIAQSIKKRLPQYGRTLFAGLAGDDFVFLRWIKRGSNDLALLRTETDDGSLVYLGLLFSDKENKKFEDIYDFSKSNFLTSSVASVINPTIKHTNNLWYRLKVQFGYERDIAKDYMTLRDLFLQGDYIKWIDVYKKLPENVRKTKNLMITYTQVALNTESNDLYREAMEEFIAEHGKNPDLSFLFVDYHIVNEQYDEARNKIKRFSGVIGGDHKLDIVEAYVGVLEGDFDQAIQSIKKAQEAYGYKYDIDSTYIDILLQKKDYAEAFKQVNAYEQRYDFSYSPSDFDDYEGVKDTNEYKVWLKARG